MSMCISKKILYIFLTVTLFHLVSYADDTQNLEYKLKALYIVRLAMFITWPKNPEKTSFKLCIDPADQVAVELKTINVRKVKGKKLEIVELSSDVTMNQCDILYISKGWVDASLTNKPVVTISSQADFAKQGGMIEFYIDQTKVRMKVNLQAVSKAGIKLESKLVRLLKVVKLSGTAR